MLKEESRGYGILVSSTPKDSSASYSLRDTLEVSRVFFYRGNLQLSNGEHLTRPPPSLSLSLRFFFLFPFFLGGVRSWNFSNPWRYGKSHQVHYRLTVPLLRVVGWRRASLSLSLAITPTTCNFTTILVLEKGRGAPGGERLKCRKTGTGTVLFFKRFSFLKLILCIV